MEFPDLQKFPQGHPPSPYNHPVRIIWVGEGMLPKGNTLKAVGWLENEGYEKGYPGDRFVRTVIKHTPDSLFSDGTRGGHCCSLCDKGSRPWVYWKTKRIRLNGHGHYLIRKGKAVYMAPSLLLHYVVSHEYLPPEEFIHATIHGEFLSEEDLEISWR